MKCQTSLITIILRKRKMKIKLEELSKSDIGRWVGYKNGDVGRIKSFNNLHVFVVFNCDNDWENFYNYTGAGCRDEDLSFVD